MKSYSVVRYDGLANPNKSIRDLQNADLSRPSDEQRLANMEKTKQELGMKVAKKTEPAYVSTPFIIQLSNNDVE